MSRPVRRRIAAVTAVLGLALALVGCNGDDDPKADPTKGSSTSTSPSDSTSSEPSEPSTPDVAPATGVLLKMPNATMNAPKGYKKLADFADFMTEANPGDGTFGAVRLSSLEYEGPTLPLDEQAKAVLSVQPKAMKRQPDVEIAGVPFYHLAGKATSVSHLDQYGVRYEGYDTTIYFEFQNDVPESEREQVIAEGLASFTWR